MGSILMRDLGRKTVPKEQLLGTAMAIQMSGAVLACMLAIGIVAFVPGPAGGDASVDGAGRPAASGGTG